MTRLLFVRHGESEANLLKVFGGSWDYPLTDLGLRQAGAAAEWMDTHYPVIDKIYASPLSRAKSTAEALASRRGMEISIEPGLREIDGGVWEGVLFSELPKKYPEEYRVWTEHMDLVHCPGGEAVAQVQKRVLDAVLRICRDNPDNTVAIFSHATSIRTQKAVWLGLPLSGISTYNWVPNASVSEVVYDNGKWTLVLDGYDGYLGDAHTELPSNI